MGELQKLTDLLATASSWSDVVQALELADILDMVEQTFQNGNNKPTILKHWHGAIKNANSLKEIKEIMKPSSMIFKALGNPPPKFEEFVVKNIRRVLWFHTPIDVGKHFTKAYATMLKSEVSSYASSVGVSGLSTSETLFDNYSHSHLLFEIKKEFKKQLLRDCAVALYKQYVVV